MHWGLVLAGGDGRRLQELTRQVCGVPIPKQYCRLLGGHSLLEATLVRSQHFAPAERTLVIVNRDHLEVGADQLHALPHENVLVQPCNRDTGPGLVFALLSLSRRNPAATLAVFPSDHYVGDDGAFIDHARHAARIVDEHPDKVVLLGIRPDRPETGYGYITPAQRFRTRSGTAAAFRVSAFWEKPTVELAHSLLADGGLWNSFVMVFRVSRMLELLELTAPREFDCMRRSDGEPSNLAELYRELVPWNFSTQVLTRIPQHLVVLRVDGVHWSDWGTRESIEQTLKVLQKVPPWESCDECPLPPAAAWPGRLRDAS
jgi:mannose-1-phosphate guanylyltransferase